MICEWFVEFVQLMGGFLEAGAYEHGDNSMKEMIEDSLGLGSNGYGS